MFTVLWKSSYFVVCTYFVLLKFLCWNHFPRTVIRSLQGNTKVWKLFPNGHLYFPQGNAKSNYLLSIWFRFLKTGNKIKDMISRYLFCFFLQCKAKLETLLNFEIHIFYKKGYKNIDYRKLVTSLYNSFHRSVIYCRKNHCKKVSPH